MAKLEIVRIDKSMMLYYSVNHYVLFRWSSKIPGAYQDGNRWKITAEAVKPADGRFKSKESLLVQIEKKKSKLDGRRPLTEGEGQRLNDEFTVEFTYNSNAIEGK